MPKSWLNQAISKPLIWRRDTPHCYQKLRPLTGSPNTYRSLALRGPQFQSRLKEGFEMNRAVYFNSPFLLGFEHLERLLERTAKSAGDGYPPYNIEQP